MDASAARIRDNQRRSRARRKEYLEDMQKKLHEYERQGVQATLDMQQAARDVALENDALRLMLQRSPVGHAAGPASAQAEQPQIGVTPGMVADATGAGVATAVQLLGLEPEALRRWLGEPSLRRADGDAEVWLYAGPACALDLVLYPNAGRLRVAHANARASGTEKRTEAHCLGELAVGPGSRPAPASAVSPGTGRGV